MKESLLSKLRSFARDRSGNVLVMSALALPVVIGFAGLATEYGAALSIRAQNQRVADMASYAGAVAYAQEASESRMRAAALNVAVMNGLDPSDVTVDLVPSPVAEGAMAVQVGLEGRQPALLSRLVSDRFTIPVEVAGMTQVGTADGDDGEPLACIIALDPSRQGIVLSGGTRIQAPTCDIASNSAIVSPCGTHVSAERVTYGSTLRNDCGGVTGEISKRTVSDPFAGHAAVAAEHAHLVSLSSMSGPSHGFDGSSGKNLVFNPWVNRGSVVSNLPNGCDPTLSGNTWTVDCSNAPSGQPVTFGSITVDGGGLVLVAGGHDRVYNVNGHIEVSGSATAEFGEGRWAIRSGVRNSGSGRILFRPGSFVVGRNERGCGNVYSICNEGQEIRFEGPSDFTVLTGIRTTWGTTVLGTGAGNAYYVGSFRNGDPAVSLASGRFLAADSSVPYRIAGSVLSDGGSCMVLGAAPRHDVRGSMSFSGGAVLGSGVWTVTGYVAFGESHGGAASCPTGNVALHAEDVTFVVGGQAQPAGWACRDTFFCAGAGYSGMVLTSPSSGPLAGLALIGPQPQSVRAGAAFSGGSSGRISGAFYLPNGPLTMAGGANVGGGSGNCFQVVASHVLLSGGTAAASDCVGTVHAPPSAGTGSSLRARLIR